MAEGIYRSGGEFPNAWLEELWSAISKTDIIKDQGLISYDEDIVQNILATNCDFSKQLLHTSLRSIIDVKSPVLNRYLGTNNSKANDNDKEHLWNCTVYEGEALSNQSYNKFNTLRGIDVGSEGQIKINGTDFLYNYKIFSRPSDSGANDFPPEDTSKILSYMDRPFIKITDTWRGGEKVLTNIKEEDLNKCIQAHTREVESDPAGKLNPNSGTLDTKSKIQKVFYYEPGTPENAGTVLYSPYDISMRGKGKNLSHFFSNRLVSLTHNGIKDKKTKRIGVDFHFQALNGNMIKVEEGANTAGALLKEKVMKCFNKMPASQKKEAVYLSKHHGDVGQLLTYYRELQLKKYDESKQIKSIDYDIIFETLDILPALKSLTIGVDSLWFYPSNAGDRKVMIIFKKLKSNIDFLVYKKNELNNLLEYCSRESIQKYNDNIEEFNRKTQKFYTDANKILDDIGRPTDNKKNTIIEYYRKILTKTVQISTLLAYIPSNILEPIVDPLEVRANIDRILSEPELTLNDIKNKINNLDTQIKIFKDIFNPLQYYNNLKDWETKVYVEENKLREVNLSKEFSIDTSEELTKTRFQDFITHITLLSFNEVSSLQNHRLGPRFINSWGLDLVLSTYMKLNARNNEIASKFIEILYNTIQMGTDDQKITFLNGIKLLNIPIPVKEDPGMVGGNSEDDEENPLEPINEMSLLEKSIIESIDRYYSMLFLINYLEDPEKIRTLIEIYVKYENYKSVILPEKNQNSFSRNMMNSLINKKLGGGKKQIKKRRTLKKQRGGIPLTRHRLKILMETLGKGAGESAIFLELNSKGLFEGKLQLLDDLLAEYIQVEKEQEEVSPENREMVENVDTSTYAGVKRGRNRNENTNENLDENTNENLDENQDENMVIDKEYGFYFFPDNSYVNILRNIETPGNPAEKLLEIIQKIEIAVEDKRNYDSNLEGIKSTALEESRLSKRQRILKGGRKTRKINNLDKVKQKLDGIYIKRKGIKK